MALMLAIGELQTSLGPDKAITANSELQNDSPAKSKLMGVWDSWDITSSLQGSGSAPDYMGEKE